MSREFKPEALTCPEPSTCTVAIETLTDLARRGRLPSTTISADTAWSRVYDSRFGRTEFNPGFGNARFSPFDSELGENRVAAIYLAGTPEAALLEGSLRDGDVSGIPEAEEESFHGLLHVELLASEEMQVADFRDPQLDDLGLKRTAISSNPSQHYPCTRTVAKAVHASRQNFSGIIWHSRQVEVSRLPRVPVIVLFEERLSRGRDAFRLNPERDSIGSLYEGEGRVQLDTLLDRLGVSVVDYWD
ncbi:RES family NAD+ phosphorylase [Brevibacterium sp. VCM10]|uniref:RES family NAD+ phosphorylase n=1 Tax=Brevibacterium sp. VCM10 TaxID=1381751 RepID=UPI0004714300|nr:RES family NAD+ phosphorylase [Brevibacterium sp. VCM10]